LAEQNETVEALPLIRKRKLLGVIIPLVNLPMLAISVYAAANYFISSSTDQFELFNSAAMIVSTILVGVVLPWWTPIYPSSYTMEKAGFRINRFLRRSLLIPYKNLERAEVYIREPGEISEDAEKYAKESSEKLRKTGFSFVDYTNSETNIVLLITGRKILMISPAKPKSFLKSLKIRSPKLNGKIVELNARGKTVKELE
jgi:hypothetical protein